MATQTIAVCNQKGGVGKTTTVVHWARAAAQQGLRVLLIDADPQGNLTAALAAEPVSDDQASLAHVLLPQSEVTLNEVLVNTEFPNVELAPTADSVLADLRDRLVSAGPGREHQLRLALEGLQGDYDLVLIDCPPSLDQLTINAMTASESVAIVTTAKRFAAGGVGLLLESIEQVRQFLNPTLHVAGAVINDVQRATRDDQHWIRETEKGLTGRGVAMIHPMVPHRIRIAECGSNGWPLDEEPDAKSRDLAEIYTKHIQTLRQRRAKKEQ